MILAQHGVRVCGALSHSDRRVQRFDWHDDVQNDHAFAALRAESSATEDSVPYFEVVEAVDKNFRRREWLDKSFAHVCCPQLAGSNHRTLQRHDKQIRASREFVCDLFHNGTELHDLPVSERELLALAGINT